MLDNFRAISVTWDHSTNTIYNNIRTASEDANGRKLVVQVVNGHQLEDLTSVDLRLYWEFDEHKGFDDFELIDEDNGIYEIHFSTDMVSHVGAHKAWLHLVDAEGTVTSEPFTVTVFEGVDADTIQDSNEFSALSNALVAISDLETNYAPRLNSVENNKADKATVNSEVSRLDQKDADLTAQLAHNKKTIDKTSFMISQGDITDLLSAHNTSSVLTGDSLSFNFQDFDVPVGGRKNTAYKNYAGLMSWAHILRDTIIRNDIGFKSAEELSIIIDSSEQNREYNLSRTKYTMPFNNKNVLLTLKADTQNSSIKIKYKHNNQETNKAVLHMSKTNSAYACLFDVYVDGELKASNVDNGGNSERYNGSEMFDVPIDVPSVDRTRLIELKNFRVSPTTPLNEDGVFGVLLSGVGTKSPEVNLTGEGGKTAEWILENVQERILQFNPDFVAMTVGANDVYHEVGVENYRDNVSNIVESIREQNADTHILLISSPAMGHENTPDSEVIKYNQALKDVAIEYNCYFIDMLKMFEHIETSKWRVDLVHLTKLGSAILGKNVIDLVMPSTLVNKKYMNTNYQIPYNTYKRSNLLDLQHGWQNVEGFDPLQWVKKGRVVRIFGSVKGGSTQLGSAIATLPEEIRLSKLKYVDALSISGSSIQPSMLNFSNRNINVSYGVSNEHLIIDFTYLLD